MSAADIVNAVATTLVDQGNLLLGGPYEGHNAGIAVLEVNDMRHPATIMNEDPGVRAGVLVYEVRQHVSIFDAFAGIRTDVNVAELDTATGDH